MSGLTPDSAHFTHHAGQAPGSLSSPVRGTSSPIDSEFDFMSYMDDDASEVATPRLPRRSASTSSVNVLTQAPNGQRSIRRRGSSRSSTSMSQHGDEIQDHWQQVHPEASTSTYVPPSQPPNQNHRRDASSASAADIGLRSLHSRHASSAAGSPLFLQTDRDASAYGSTRPYSTGAWSQVSLGDIHGDETDLGGRFADNDRNDYDEDDRVHLTRAQSSDSTAFAPIRRLSISKGHVPNKRLYDSPVPPDSDLNDDNDRSVPASSFPPDLESSPETARRTRASSKGRRSVRAKGTEGYYQRSGSGADVDRSRSMVENAKRGIKRMSVRMVNLRQRDEARHVRLDDSNEPDPIHLDDHSTRTDVPTVTASGPDSPPDEPVEEDIAGWGMGDGVLRGRTLGAFGPDSRIRKAALALFLWSWTEPIILLLIVTNVVILTIQSADNVFENPRPTGRGYFHTWEDLVLFILFVCFTVELLARMLVSGLIFNPEENPGRISLVERCKLVWSRLQGKEVPLQRSASQLAKQNKYANTHSLQPPTHHLRYGTASTNASSISLNEFGQQDSAKHFGSSASMASPSYPPQSAHPTLRSFRSTSNLLSAKTSKSTLTSHTLAPSTIHEDVPFVRAMQAQQHQTLNHQKAFLRHSWNRVDFVAVLSFWIMFLLAMLGVESKDSIYIFRALSTLRAARLLTVTAGTTTILRSLKQSAPLLIHVAFFVVFAMVLFSLVGVQTFKGSYKRSCVWVDPNNQTQLSLDGQMCGGHVNDTTGLRSGYIPSGSDAPISGSGKGFICPLGQLCVEGDNPNNGTQSFDNVVSALMQVVITTGANGWSTQMFNMIDAEYFISCLYFIFCLVLLNFWLMNILVAIIINTFANIREESKHSAFAGKSNADMLADVKDNKDEKKSKATYAWRRVVNIMNWAWIGLIIADVGVQASKTAKDAASRTDMLNQLELYFTLAFLVEIVVRFMSYLPDYRAFVKRASNIADFSLVLITTLIQIPFIRNSPVYPWLTAFQLMRFYRVILAVPRMKPLLAKVISSVTGLINMVLFLLLMNFLGAVLAVQFLRGEVPAEADGGSIQYSFYQIYNSFLAIYIIFSSENWTDILYPAIASSTRQGWVTAIFLAGWFLLANFVLLQLFIAVVGEGFSIVEEEKQKAQMEAFVKKSEPQAPTVSWISRWNPYRFVIARPKVVNVGSLPSELVLPLGKATVRDYMSQEQTGLHPQEQAYLRPEHASDSFVSALKRTAKRKAKPEHRARKSFVSGGDLDIDAQLDLLNYGGRDRNAEGRDAESERRAVQSDFITAHPTYDKALWIFSQKNPIRRFCQRVVEPAHGERIFGVEPYSAWSAAFKILILCAIAASVSIAAIATPVYRREYYLEHGNIRLTWFNLTESSLGFIFVIEFLIKIVADGFIFSPNAYLLSIWNMLDFFVLVTVLVNVATALSPDSSATNTFTRSLKAFRALRLVNLSATMRQTFYNVLIIGASRIFDAAVLLILYIIPFSVWGQNLFSGLFFSCNDGNVLSKFKCANEFTTSPLQWEFLAPRAWQNPYVYSFDSFRSAFLILFEIVSLEGWTGVMASAISITGRDLQPSDNAAQYNSIYFLIYNLLGAITVLALFVSLIIENFTVRSGMALLTTEQRQWVDLKKLILRQRPAKRPKRRPADAWRGWCYDRAVSKHGWWSRTMTGLYLVHIAILLSQTDGQPAWADTMRDYMFLLLTFIYAFDIFVRLSGLGWKSFSQVGWNLYDVFVVTGTFATTIPLLLGNTSQTATQLQKLFLVSIAFKLVQKNNQLNQLFKTAVSSLAPILNIFGLWLALFLVWSILFLEVFSLTKWQTQETYMQNYSTFPKAMIMLALMSTGEGWNTFMHDYTVESPYCSPSDSYLFNDCGSAPYAFLLFISWNIISMYIFLNMLTGVVVESFSYVFSLYGKVTSVSREEMRLFKKTWAIYDTGRTGYMKRKDLIPFFSRLSGVFDVRLYSAQHRVKTLRRTAAWDFSRPPTNGRVVEGLDLVALESQLQEVDYEEVARRKKMFNRLYHEALLTEEPGRGISFTKMLLMLAQYKLIDADKSLQLEDLLQRKAKAQRVDDLVSLDRVRGLLRTIWYRRKFLEHRTAVRQAETNVPAIVLDNDDEGRDSFSHYQRPSLSLDTSALSMTPPAGFRSPASTPPPGDLLSPRTSSVGDYLDYSSSPTRRTNRHSSEEDIRRASMSDNYAADLANSDWAKLMEEEMAIADK